MPSKHPLRDTDKIKMGKNQFMHQIIQALRICPQRLTLGLDARNDLIGGGFDQGLRLMGHGGETGYPPSEQQEKCKIPAFHSGSICARHGVGRYIGRFQNDAAIQWVEKTLPSQRGAERENRTLTRLPPPDFESGASTSSAISAGYQQSPVKYKVFKYKKCGQQ